jgi:methanogenic corrinoid protein MtbC1
MTIDRTIKALLAPAQERVGELWHANAWTWAQEHAVTSVTDAVLGALRLQQPATEHSLGFLVTACVEGDFHATPARMGSELLRAAGWDVVFTGASTSAHDLQKFVARTEPTAVVLGCSMTQFLPSARRCIEAVRAVGVPVAVGGRGFGANSHRSRRLGADAWIGDHVELSDAVRAATRRGGTAVESVPAAFRLELALPALVDASERAVFRRGAAPRMTSAIQRAWARETIENVFRHVAIAIDLDDPAVIRDLLVWLTELLAHRNVRTDEVRQSLAVLCDTMSGADVGDSAGWLVDACTHIGYAR